MASCVLAAISPQVTCCLAPCTPIKPPTAARTAGTGLYELWKKGLYRNYPPDKLVDLVARVLALLPPWVRVYRIQVRGEWGGEAEAGAECLQPF